MDVNLLPRFHRLKLKLEEDILNRYRPGEKFLTQREIMTRYEASFSTVERALRELVNEGVLVRLHGKGTFVCEKKPFAAEGSMKVALVMTRNVTYGPTSFYSEILMRINDELSAAGYSFSFIYIEDSSDSLFDRLTGKDGFCGALLIGMIDETVAEELLRLRFPFVVVDRSIDIAGVCCVATDNVNGAAAAVSYLIGKGHRRIGFVSTALHTSFLERYEGYCTALAEHGIVLNRNYIQKHFHFDTAADDLLPMISQAEPPTAIFTPNDTMGVHVVRALARLGRKIPDDISVMGFDNDYIGAHIEVPLSTMAVPRQEMGLAAVIRLQQLIAGQAAESLVLPVVLIERESVRSPGKKAQVQAG